MIDETGPYLIRSTPRAMLRFGLGSACTIATLLCIPDGVAIIPKAQNLGVWLIRLVGLWLSCYCLWTFGFVGLLYLVRAFTRGVEFHEGGFKLWRFGKLVSWDSVRGVSCEPQPIFAKAFCLPNVHRLVVYCAKGDKIHPHNIPSFQFDPADFQSMLVYITERCFGVQPSAPDLVLADESIRAPIKMNYERGRQMRTLMSVIICFSLVMYLGRKAVVNYSFNMGLKEYKQEHYAAAAEFYKRATFFEPTFAPAWDQLARCEYRMYKHKEAEEHWLKALQMKPDYVESKIGLATLHMLRHEYGPARQLLKKAIHLSPTNVAAFMSYADLLIREYQYTTAIELLQHLVQKDESNERARGLLARALIRSDRLREALRVLGLRDKSTENNAFSDDAFMELVGAEADIALGRLDKAQAELTRLRGTFGTRDMPDDLLLDFIALRKAQSDELEMNELTEIAMKRGIPADEIDAAKRIAMAKSEATRW